MKCFKNPKFRGPGSHSKSNVYSIVPTRAHIFSLQFQLFGYVRNLKGLQNVFDVWPGKHETFALLCINFSRIPWESVKIAPNCTKTAQKQPMYGAQIIRPWAPVQFPSERLTRVLLHQPLSVSRNWNLLKRLVSFGCTYSCVCFCRNADVLTSWPVVRRRMHFFVPTCTGRWGLRGALRRISTAIL